MPEHTPRADFYLPGGGLSGTIPDEEVDIDQINNNFRKIDNLLGAPECTSTSRPTSPISGQLAFETDTRNLIKYSAALTKWEPVGTPNCPSKAYRDEIFGSVPSVGSRAHRLDRLWVEEYFDATTVTVAGWYPVSGRLPSILIKHNGTLVTAGGGAWTPVRDSWNWAAAELTNVAEVMAWETGMFKSLIPGEFEYTYALDLNMPTGNMILAISEFTASHAFADNRAIASSTFPRASGRVGGPVTVRKVVAANQMVQGNVFPDSGVTLDPSRPTTNYLKARYVGPPFKP